MRSKNRIRDPAGLLPQFRGKRNAGFRKGKGQSEAANDFPIQPWINSYAQRDNTTTNGPSSEKSLRLHQWLLLSQRDQPTPKGLM